MKLLELMSLTCIAVFFVGCAETRDSGRDSVIVGQLSEIIRHEQRLDLRDGQLWTLVELTEKLRLGLSDPPGQFAHLADVEHNIHRGRTLGWQKNYRVHACALVEKAKRFGYDSESLSKVLDHIQDLAPGSRIAFLPIGAYVGTCVTSGGPEPVWAIVLQWEFDCVGARSLGHDRVYAFNQKNMQQVGFVTCE